MPSEPIQKIVPMQERLQKILARAGVASRRHAEELILAGHVSVNGRVVTQLGTKADVERDAIKVSGRLVRAPATKTYILLHKPAESVSTMSDPAGRRCLRDFLEGVRGRVFPVGRLEYHAAGLLLLTNDGELASRMLRAAGRLEQVYWLKVKGRLSEAEKAGVEQRAGARLRLLAERASGRRAEPNPWYEASVTDARRDLLRRSLAQLGHPVEKLKRAKLAGLDIGSLPPGRYRFLTTTEVSALESAVSRSLAGPLRAGGEAPPISGKRQKPEERTAGHNGSKESTSSNRVSHPGQRAESE